MMKCSTPSPAIQAAAAFGNCVIRVNSPAMKAIGRKQSTPIGTVMAMACIGVPLTTPRRTEALLKANAAADRIAKVAPSTCGPDFYLRAAV